MTVVDAPSSQPGEPTERLQEIQQRLEKATPGPWKLFVGESGTTIEVQKTRGKPAVVGWPGFDDSHVRTDCHRANADLIAHAPGDLSYLLGEVASLRLQNAELRAQVVQLERRNIRLEDEIIDAMEVPGDG